MSGPVRVRSAARRALPPLLLALALATAGPAGAVTPGAKHVLAPAALGLHAEDVRFPAADSAEVTGWWLEGPADASTVVIAARGTGTMADLLPAARDLMARGFAVLLFDYRGFGPGADPVARDTLQNVIFSSQWVDDMLGALRYARSRTGRHVFAWGQDLGSAVALAAAARERPACDAVAIEGVFTTSQEFLRDRGLAGIPGVEDQHRRLVLGPDEPLSAASRLMIPLFAVLAGKDDVTPGAGTAQVIRRTMIGTERWPLPQAGHAGTELTPGYFDRIAAWFRQWTAFPAGGRQP